jgi:hypothetical protein
MKALPRPQRKQRFLARVLNFGFFFDLAITDVFAMNKIVYFIDDILYFFLKPWTLPIEP